MRAIGVNTWVWTSPLDDAALPARLRHVRDLGFDVVELPLEHPGLITPESAAASLLETGLSPCVVGAMGPGRDLVATDPTTVQHTQAYLRACIDLAAGIGAEAVCGPFYAATGRVWRITPDERPDLYRQWRENLEPVLEYAGQRSVRIGIEPLNRYETSVVNTVEQTLEALAPLLGPTLGLALDSYHLNIEERSTSAAIELAGEHLVHLQVCGNDRGAPGGDQTDWSAVLDALDRVGYDGPLVIESFTADNATIATAASIWRPLAPTQDDLASSGLAFLRELMTSREEPA